MITLHRSVTSTADPHAAFVYLADFSNAEEWDSGTVRCERVSGDGGVGTTYRNVSRFGGRNVELEYTVEKVDEPTFVIVGRNKSTTSRDTIVVTPGPTGGCRVDYTAEFEFSGLARYLGPVVRPLLDRLGDNTAKQLTDCLDRL